VVRGWRVPAARVRLAGVRDVHLDGRPADPQPEARVPGHDGRHRRGLPHLGQVRRLRQTLHGPLLFAGAPPPVQPGRPALGRLGPPDVHPDAVPGTFSSPERGSVPTHLTGYSGFWAEREILVDF